MPVTRSDVVWAYRTFLGREPENDRVLNAHCAAANLRALCEIFLASSEFEVRAGASVDSGCTALPVFLPPLEVETSANADELRLLWEKVRWAWESLGRERPFHSVLTDDRFVPTRLEEFEPHFWQSGEIETERLAEFIVGLGLVELAAADLLEFGCGVGRVTVPLAAIARNVIAYDISEPHLQIARARAAALGRTNIGATSIGEGLPAAFEPCDLFYSRIVLQHNPPPIIGYVLRRLIRALRPGGVGIFQVPTYFVGYRFSVREALAAPQNLDMDMHCFPQAQLHSLITEEGARLVQVRDDDATGRRDLFVSNTLVITKPV